MREYESLLKYEQMMQGKAEERAEIDSDAAEKAAEDAKNKSYVTTVFNLLKTINPQKIQVFQSDKGPGQMWGRIEIHNIPFFFVANNLFSTRTLPQEMQSIVLPGMHELTTSWWVHKPYAPGKFLPPFYQNPEQSMEILQEARTDLAALLVSQGQMNEGGSLSTFFKGKEEAYTKFLNTFDGETTFKEQFGVAVSLTCNEKQGAPHAISSHNTHHGKFMRDWLKRHHVPVPLLK